MFQRVRADTGTQTHITAETAATPSQQTHPTTRTPWRTRRRIGLQPNHVAAVRVTPTEWPQEPHSPQTVDIERMSTALRQLCQGMGPQRAHRYADWMITYGKQFDTDPFLLGALLYRQTLGGCRPNTPQHLYGGVGPMGLEPAMYRTSIKGGAYHYYIKENSAWSKTQLPITPFIFGPARIERTQESLYFAAAFLSSWNHQHEEVDQHYTQQPHRHAVSHYIWGDRVRSARQEDRLFTDRRRLLQYYGAHASVPPYPFRGVMLGAPLDGAPRVPSSGLGTEREHGARRHRGLDLESMPGEPVRAMANGTVIFAGVDLPGPKHRKPLEPSEYNTVPRRSLGAGGRFVCVRHATLETQPQQTTETDTHEPVTFRTCYMHLQEVHVSRGTRLALGQQLGTVGRTGMRSSAAHLHLEFHVDGQIMDPLGPLQPFLRGRPTEP